MGIKLVSLILNTRRIILLHKFYAFREGKGWCGHLNAELGLSGLFPSMKWFFIVQQSGLTISLKVLTWRYIRHALIWVLCCFDSYSLPISVIVHVSFCRWWFTVRNMVVNSWIWDSAMNFIDLEVIRYWHSLLWWKYWQVFV